MNITRIAFDADYCAKPEYKIIRESLTIQDLLDTEEERKMIEGLINIDNSRE